MKKSFVVLTILAMIFCLNGCSVAENHIKNTLLEKSGIIQDENYINYQQQLTQGKIDSSGYYDETSGMEDYGTIKVTCASNSNLIVEYYLDSEKKMQIDTSNLFLNPGDTLYANVKINPNISSSSYKFARFDAYDFDSTNSRIKLDWNTICEADAAEIQIPADYSGNDLLLEPIGEFIPREVTLRDFYKDDNDIEKDLTYTWFVNDETYDEEAPVKINPVSSYVISYEYDPKEYFFVNSDPECFSNVDGTVVFYQKESNDPTENYTVELHKYLTVDLPSSLERTITLKRSFGEIKEMIQNGSYELTNLKYGEKVVIETNKKWDELEENREILLTNTERLRDDSYRYTLIVPEKGGEFSFDPALYEDIEHGTLTFKCFGSTVNGPQLLAPGTRIYYEEKEAEDGYWLSPGEHCVVVSDEETTKNELESIRFSVQKQTKVSLIQPDKGGSVVYYVDGSKIYGDSINLYSGNVISMEFNEWSGWMIDNSYTDNQGNPLKDGYQYTVPEYPDSVSIDINGKNINSLFVEDPQHKPKLTVIIEKSVGEGKGIYFSASGISRHACIK